MLIQKGDGRVPKKGWTRVLSPELETICFRIPVCLFSRNENPLVEFVSVTLSLPSTPRSLVKRLVRPTLPPACVKIPRTIGKEVRTLFISSSTVSFIVFRKLINCSIGLRFEIPPTTIQVYFTYILNCVVYFVYEGRTGTKEH